MTRALAIAAALLILAGCSAAPIVRGHWSQSDLDDPAQCVECTLTLMRGISGKPN